MSKVIFSLSVITLIVHGNHMVQNSRKDKKNIIKIYAVDRD